jgi:hypothetical protein
VLVLQDLSVVEVEIVQAGSRQPLLSPCGQVNREVDVSPQCPEPSSMEPPYGSDVAGNGADGQVLVTTEQQVGSCFTLLVGSGADGPHMIAEAGGKACKDSLTFNCRRKRWPADDQRSASTAPNAIASSSPPAPGHHATGTASCAASAPWSQRPG